MPSQKIKLIKDKGLDKNLYIIYIFLVLVAVAFFSAANLITAVELHKQTKIILTEAFKINPTEPQNNNQVLPSAETIISTVAAAASDTTPPPTSPPVINFSNTYTNATAEPFFGTYLIDSSQTTMHLDDVVTALTFEPVYDLSRQQDCAEPLCGLRDQGNPSCLPQGCLSETNGELYYQDKKIALPDEFRYKTITNFTFSPLDTKWVVGIVISEGRQEVGYAYLFDGSKLQPLITDNTIPQIKTQHGYGGGKISAGGSDQQFIILYSGYEGIGFLYNNGSWQNLSAFFGLRVTKGGFKSKIIKGGSGNLASWYVCSEDLAKPKLIKLWQNDTNNIQGSIDLSTSLGQGAAICAPQGDRAIKIARSVSGQNSLYIFKDQGFKNSNNYRYQSANLNDNVGQKIISVHLNSYTINARPELYSLAFSTDGENWQPNTDSGVIFDNKKNLDTFYIKAEFKTDGAEYSPWFGGLDIISYTVENKK